MARKLSGVRAFLRYLVRDGLLAHDPSGAAVAPKLDRKVPRHLSEADMTTLLETPDAATPLGRRDRAPSRRHRVGLILFWPVAWRYVRWLLFSYLGTQGKCGR